MRYILKVFILVFFIFSGVPIISDAHAHSLFNSSEETLGDYRVQIATLPEFPQIGEKSEILIRVTDDDFNEVERFAMGMRIFFNEEQVNNVQPAFRNTSYVFQQYSIYPQYSVYDNLAFPLRSPLRKSDKKTIDDRVHEIARLLKIENKLNNKATQLSGGEMQRVSLGRALV